MTQLTSHTNRTKLIHSSHRLLCCCLLLHEVNLALPQLPLLPPWRRIDLCRPYVALSDAVLCLISLSHIMKPAKFEPLGGSSHSLLKTFNKVIDLCSWCRIVLRTSRYILNQTILRIVYFIISSSEIPLLKLIVVIAVPLKWMHESPPLYWTATLSSVALIGCV